MVGRDAREEEPNAAHKSSHATCSVSHVIQRSVLGVAAQASREEPMEAEYLEKLRTTGQVAEAVHPHAQRIRQQPASMLWLGRATIRARQPNPLRLSPTLAPKCEPELDRCAGTARRSRPPSDTVRHPPKSELKAFPRLWRRPPP